MKKSIIGALCLTVCVLTVLSSCIAESGRVVARTVIPVSTARTADTTTGTAETTTPLESDPTTIADSQEISKETDVPAEETPTPTGTPASTTDISPLTTETPVSESETGALTAETPESEKLTIDRMTVEKVDDRLYKLTGSGGETVLTGILYGRYLITICGEAGERTIVSRDLVSGGQKMLYKIPEDRSGNLLKLDRGGFLFTDYDGGSVYFKDGLDDEPQILRESIVYDDPSGEEWVNCTYLPDGRRILTKGDVLTVENVFDGGCVTAEIPRAYLYLRPVCAYEDKLAFFAPVYDGIASTLVLLLDPSGVFEEIGMYDGNSLTVSKCGELFRVNGEGDLERYAFPTLETADTICFRTSGEYYSFSNGEYLITTSYRGEATVLSIYDYDSRLYFCNSTPFGYAYTPDMQDDVVLVLCSAPYDGEADAAPLNTICFIDLAGAEGEEAPDYRKALKEKIEEIGSKYPVTILTGGDALIDFPDFTAQSMKNDVRAYEAVVVLEEVLSDFPTGFFDELFSSDDAWPIDHMTICLTGRLAPTTEYSISNPAAYAYTTDEMQYIVADVGYTSILRSNFAHELMHAIDFYLAYTLSADVYPEWHHYVAYMSLYNYGYTDGSGNDFYDDSYTTSDEGREWFIDSYSKTFPIEDRARLFENLFCYAENGCWFKSYGRILDRMEYLADVIREHFDSVKNGSEKPIWERAIEEARIARGEIHLDETD